MLEALQAGLGGARPDGARQNTQELLRARLADLTLLCRGLSPEQERVYRARYAGVGAVRPYTRLRRLGDRREGDGEELTSLRPSGPDGERLEGWAEVSGWRAELPSYAAIGSEMSLTPGQVRGLQGAGKSRERTTEERLGGRAVHGVGNHRRWNTFFHVHLDTAPTQL